MTIKQVRKISQPNLGTFKTGGRIDVKKSKAEQNKKKCRNKCKFKEYFEESNKHIERITNE